jgi:transposase
VWRPDRGGNRQINRALHVIAITRGRLDPETHAYLKRKEAEGKTRMEAMRCLKRHLARRYHRLLLRPPVAPHGGLSAEDATCSLSATARR